MSVLTNGPVTLPEVTGRILLAADEASLDSLLGVVAALPDTARGQVFVEVGSADDIVSVETPELVSVAWLTRESRSGNPGTSRRCAHGQALERAVRAWVSEMTTGDPDFDGGELTVWIDGAGTRVYELRQELIAQLGSKPTTAVQQDAGRQPASTPGRSA
ncbi:SIP domain-containing protein [Subtercola boreus]|uniref:SIP-like Rossmann fold domain-containing protein n=1 Tax=Subtercola boreus TaxID=120213 RepID=A0A3E0W9J5_9MICO|nr:SIP domain-containing protein [Subtercola boreus]RFA20297.1 hypothetical protein B7R24_09840 [Subtercola boreus]RFA20449.1 hypothetical protein B7R23_09775 [Subtercola boreus]RFA26699.1 hypothetical protein B7R25_09905 [Subtercola boreus]